MKILLASLLALVTAVWGWDVIQTVIPPGVHPLWFARQEALYLSGLLSIALMSLVMLLATRPTWLESPLGGMDRIYRTHKWAGILAVSFATVHWLVEMGGDVLKSTIGREGRVPKERFIGFLEILRDLGKDMGEWALYALLAMLLITLWKKFPYRAWRLLHRAMPVLYLMLALHAVMLAPTDYWAQPAGALLAALLLVGVYGALRSLLGNIGRARLTTGELVAVTTPVGGVTSVSCRLERNWRGHQPGQFAFVTFDDKEGAHPFTIASADQGDGVVNFQIKGLGDYTDELASRVHLGQKVRVEGPYGRFEMGRRHAKAQQIWIAGGIGVTPFLAWLESLHAQGGNALVADLHYCTRDRNADPFVARLENLCKTLPGIRLQVHGARQGGLITAGKVLAGKDSSRLAEVWFCGPQGLADSLKEGLRASWRGKFRFHQEAFGMR